jgi:hypothetical protein
MVCLVRFLDDPPVGSKAKETHSSFFLFGGASWILHNGLDHEFGKWIEVSMSIGDI